MAQYTPMIQQYLTIKEQAKDAFLFFRLGDFYELFFEDAIRASEELEITLTSRDGGGNPIPMCGVPHHSAPTYIQKLINKGYKVAICDQVETPSAAKGVVKREIVRVVTPGTIMEESMLIEQENNFLLCITEQIGQYALSAVDLSTGECYVTEMENEALLYNEVAFYQPREILVDDSLSEGWVSGLRQRTKTLITKVSIPLEKETELCLALKKQYSHFDEVCSSIPLKHAMKLLYTYLYQTQKRSLSHLQRLQHYESNMHMILDDSARRNLELTMSLDEKKKKGSLLWFLNRTATAMGSRLLKRWLDKPLLRIEEIRGRQEIVATFVEDIILLDKVKETLKKVFDLERLLGRIAYGTANARDLNALKCSLDKIPQLKQTLLSSQCTSLHKIGKLLDTCPEIVELIEKAIVDDPPVSLKEGNLICEGYNGYLDELRDIQRNGKSWITELEQREREETGIKSLKIGFNRVFGYYIEVTKSNLRLLPEGRYHRKQTLANAERFVTAELKEKEELILTANEKSIDMEYDLFVEIRGKISQEIKRIQKASELVAKVDVLHAFAVVAKENRYTCPTVHGKDHLLIEEGRHPVVEALVSEKEFIANDVALNTKDRQIYLITGPNMAGKSTYMRQVAIITILSQIGSFVPAKKAEVSIIDKIFTRIGAADDLVGGRSTFMVEMEETCKALREATPRSLILLDEIGRGTSTYDGIALAHAIVEYIHNFIGAKTLFSTHYHELTGLDRDLPRLVNVHAKCVEKNEKVVFLHRIVPGGADRSYGIYVAELAGIPTEVIEKAKLYLHSLEDQSKSVNMVKEQMELFSCAKETQEAYSTSSEEEIQVLEKMRSWDLMSKSPLDTMMFLSEMQNKLK